MILVLYNIILITNFKLIEMCIKSSPKGEGVQGTFSVQCLWASAPYYSRNINRTQRISPLIPSCWVGVYPTAGYDATQQLGIRRLNCWV